MSNLPPDDDSDIAAAYERAMQDPAYAAKLSEQIKAEWALDANPMTCGECGTVILEDEYGHDYCPQCDPDA